MFIAKADSLSNLEMVSWYLQELHYERELSPGREEASQTRNDDNMASSSIRSMCEVTKDENPSPLTYPPIPGRLLALGKVIDVERWGRTGDGGLTKSWMYSLNEDRLRGISSRSMSEIPSPGVGRLGVTSAEVEDARRVRTMGDGGYESAPAKARAGRGFEYGEEYMC